MINCRPTHALRRATHHGDRLARTGRGDPRQRFALQPAELNEATELDRGDVAELATSYQRLNAILPDLRVVGGCCGTDHEHVATIAESLAGVRTRPAEGPLPVA